METIPRKFCISCKTYKIIDCFNGDGSSCNSCTSGMFLLQEKLWRRLRCRYDFFSTHGCNLPFLYEWLEFTKKFFCSQTHTHIDHLIPLSRFDRSKPSHMSLVNNWANLRYIPAKANMDKGATMPPKQDLVLQTRLCAQFLKQRESSSGYFSISQYNRCVTVFNMFYVMKPQSYFYFTGRTRL